MRVEIWSEVTCPWCGLGGHRLQRAVERFEHGEHVEVADPLGSGFPEGSVFTVRDALQGRDLAPADRSAGRYGVAGAQDSDGLLQLLRRAWDETHPVTPAPSGPGG
ncbi:hypothetical protein FH608_016125 [Nonomuraea phyllanthi]|uniref:Uncharacterized protein n=1 Tax=Nonomuraea phyllanthi TaxID=2219224 RepID=A0A5C4WL40_9ACTN|nr:hypothetical protein [Nonomuraea phyllanthi]KAB8194706.1 hypothetical protein FH608_016125 [Nonomuraea phyllanthi]QFY09127.1 hypothetical protein GBF35_22840 [Nonomuraea phyllanthi]